jgi:citrate lyase subunit beta / citryl-CoA lyase
VTDSMPIDERSYAAAARALFTPTAEDIAEAEAVVKATGRGVAVIDGRMVDAVHVTMAREILHRAADG